jgi:outer membrane usher protein
MPTAGNDVQELLLAVTVNEDPLPPTMVLQQADGRVLARTSDLVRWRFVLPPVPPIVRDGERYLALDTWTEMRYRIDPATQTLHIDAAARNFASTTIPVGARRYSEPPPPPLGAFFNYDLAMQTASRQTTSAGLFEAVSFSRWGSLSASAVARNGTIGGAGSGVVRLDTTWTLDRPAELATFRVGDAISRAGSGSQAVRFAGVQYATNFGTQPGFVTFPMPSLAGEAALPSTVDLYVNDALRMRREVPSGPFSIPELPVVTGQGEARIVVRDMLGRQQTIVAAFYTSAQLLQPGLRDFSYELGALRANYGATSDDYGSVVAVATERRGLTETVTGEVHGELERDRQAVGIGAVWLWPAIGVFSASIAGSRSTQHAGALMSLGFQRQSTTLSFGGNVVTTTDGFVPLGLPADSSPARLLAQGYASYATERYGSFGVNYVRQNLRDRPDVELVGANYGVTLGSFGSLSLSVMRNVRGQNTFAGLSFSRPLDMATNFGASLTGHDGSGNAQVQVQRNLPAGPGFGYRLLAAAGDTNRVEGNVFLQSNYGTYAFDAALTDREAAFRAGATGGIGLLGGHVFASRTINESFAVVDIPGYADVRVYADNQLVGRTGADGAAMMPRLLPYQKNAIRVEQADLPLDASVDALGADLTPYYRSGVLFHVPIRRSRGGVISVVLDDGQPVPAGAIAAIPGSPATFPAAQQGEIYLTGLDKENTVQVTWREQRCEIKVAFPETADPLPLLGTFVCAGVKR